MTKYRNMKTTIDGIKFDSKLEAKRYMELSVLLKAGKIEKLQVHPSFELIPSYRKNGKTVRKTVYEADFSYFRDGKYVIEDVKGVETAVFRLKKKLFEYRYPWQITILKGDRK